jgi:hypothetical protein
VLAYHDTKSATLHPVVGTKMPEYTVSTTLRLPTGESVSLGDNARVEHLDYRTLIGQVPTFDVSIDGIWKEAWGYRVSYPGGTVRAANGPVTVPAFDLGFDPQYAKDEPRQDAAGNGQTQRIPFAVNGSYGGCPVNGFSWSELIVNWYGHEGNDPWYHGGGSLPATPAGCGAAVGAGPSAPPSSAGAPGVFVPTVQPDTGCTAYNPGAPTCTYVAKTNAGVAGYSAAPGGWTVTITRAGLPAPMVVRSLGGTQTYQCGTIRPGDSVSVTAESGSYVSVGNPGFCF